MRCIGLFAGIGGMELALANAGHRTALLCEVSPIAQAVLREHFPHVEIRGDIRKVDRLPPTDIITAGFPCQDLSQAGTGAGIRGKNSGLVKEVFRLVERARPMPSWLVFENVPFMLSLKKGTAMAFVVDALERLGYSWAYRVVDARAFGVPQRRRRVLLLASRSHDPRAVLLGEDHGDEVTASRWDSGRGFYWTEGTRGLGWARGAVPTIKGGSGIGIASPPAIWFPARRSMELPSLRDAERLQGFEADWTKIVEGEHGARTRWKLIGNAVCVPMMEWLARRLISGQRHDSTLDAEWDFRCGWPDAAWGRNGKRRACSVSAWPISTPRPSINTFLRHGTTLLSFRATDGFLRRATASTLRFEEGFLADVAHHARRMKRAMRQ